LLLVQARLQPAAVALDEIGPYAFAGLVAEHLRHLGLGYVPVAGGDLVGELARLPADEAGEQARLAGQLVQDAIDGPPVARDEDVAEEMQRRLARILAHYREHGAKLRTPK
jgi:hypothetical protein